MSGRDPEAVEIFISETLEALQRSEALLLDAERGKVRSDMFATLFRDLHTIKGNAGYLNFEISRKLAHAAEDLLAALLDNRLTPQPAYYRSLLAVDDRLQQLVAQVRHGGEEGQVDVSALLAELQKATQTAAAEPARSTESVEAHHEAFEKADASVRVNVTILDRLMDLVGELVLARNQMTQLARVVSDGSGATQALAQRLDLITAGLQAQVMKTRMHPMSRVFEKIPRMVRDLALATAKEVEARIEGNATEIDRAMVEAVRDPIMHIIRNAIDHGIESPAERATVGKPAQGQLWVRAAHVEGMVVVEIEDDGRGTDPHRLRAHAVKTGLMTPAEAERLSDREAVELIFRAGFSTAAAVTDISGRGVGMFAVRTQIEQAGGQVEIDSRVGKGSVVRLKVPLTLAVIPAMLVQLGAHRFAIPQASVMELVGLDAEGVSSQVEYVRGAPIYRLRGEVLPLVRLGALLGMPANDAQAAVNIVVLVGAGQRYGLVVDDIDSTDEIVIKSLHGHLKRLSIYAGATVLGDGKVALVLDAAGLAVRAGLDALKEIHAHATAASVVEAQTRPMLVFSVEGGGRCAVPLATVARLEEVPISSIQRNACGEATLYRDALLPVIRLDGPLALPPPRATRKEQTLIVFDFGRKVGLAIDEIIDIADAPLASLQGRSDVPYVLTNTVLLGAATLILDIERLLAELAPQSTMQHLEHGEAPRLLLVGGLVSMRAALAAYLQATGYKIVEVNTGVEALEVLRKQEAQRIDAVVLDTESRGMRPVEIMDAIKREVAAMPVLAWRGPGDDDEEVLLKTGISACIPKGQRDRLIAAIMQHAMNGRGRSTRSVA